MRLIVKKSRTPAEDLGVAEDVRRALWAKAPVKVDSQYPLHGIHRDEQKRAYFEFATDAAEEVCRVLREHLFSDRFELTETNEPLGEACQNCGNIAGPVLPTVCPNCSFRDISPCPSCGREIPRQKYISLGEGRYRCPNCGTLVRMRFSEPMFGPDGDYNQPLVVVEEAEVHRV
jgi:DNA-directed RNA polymerase subunit RPC12/RpoP